MPSTKVVVIPTLGRVCGEQVVGPAVDGRRRDDVVAGPGEVEDRQRLGRLAGRETERGDAALERGDALLEDVGRRVHDPGVDVPEFLEAEEPGRMRGVVEDVGRRGVDRDGAGVGRRVGLLAGMEGAGLGAEGGGSSAVTLVSPRKVGDGWSGREARWPWEGRWVLAVTRRVDRRKQKSRSSTWNCSPGTSSVVPRLSDQDARDLRPHPPYGGAASAYTCSRRLGCESRSANGRPRDPCVVNHRAETQPWTRPYDGDDDRHPGHVPCLCRGEGRATAWSAASARSPRRTCRPARSRSASSGRASTTRTAWRRGRTARSRGSARSSPGSTSQARSSRPRTRGSRSVRPSWRTATSWASRATADTPSTSACRPVGSSRWRPGLSPRDAMSIGTAGFTAAMSVVALEERGLTPSDGPVLVTGASGGVGGTALAILADRGYEVWAATGKPDEAARLRAMGAAGILARDEVTGEGRPLESERWAGAVDAVGAATLPYVLRTLRIGAAVASSGNAGGAEARDDGLPVHPARRRPARDGFGQHADPSPTRAVGSPRDRPAAARPRASTAPRSPSTRSRRPSTGSSPAPRAGAGSSGSGSRAQHGVSRARRCSCSSAR